MTWSLSFFGCKHTTELNKLCGEERKCFITSITPAIQELGKPLP